MDTEILYQLLSTVITIIISVIAPRVVRWLNARLSAEQLGNAQEVARIVVRAVEQTVVAVHGEDKLRAALTQAQSMAATVGLKLAEEQWKSLLEQAVLEMNERHSWAQPPRAS